MAMRVMLRWCLAFASIEGEPFPPPKAVQNRWVEVPQGDARTIASAESLEECLG